ncbi:MAG: class C sortase [Lachnospiraceae bacterium]|nr:class C sortase [Lachnospiraceae bacterium]
MRSSRDDSGRDEIPTVRSTKSKPGGSRRAGGMIFRILLLILVMAAGVGLMAYPFLANWIFVNRADSLVSSYDAQVENTEEEKLQEARELAEYYNEAIATGHVELRDPFTEESQVYSESTYYELLDVTGTGLMGYISIPCIDVTLPVYHGTDSSTLEKGVGHLPGSSLPVGGASTHCVLTGHTGLSSAKLFTDLTELEEGDIFILTVLGEKLAYEVDQILVVEPNDISSLQIESGADYCTLITCTPYGINSHRLLVRGVRTEYEEEYEEAGAFTVRTGESQWMNEYMKALGISIALLIVALLLLFAVRMLQRKLRRRRRQDRHRPGRME